MVTIRSYSERIFVHILAASNWYHYNTIMKSLHIRDIPPDTLDALKRLAKGHHRSLQGELHAILELAARSAPPSKTESLEWIMVSTGKTEPTWSRSEIYDTDGR
jgi:hypothetical protein